MWLWLEDLKNKNKTLKMATELYWSRKQLTVIYEIDNYSFVA